ncbi:YtcA family lipoprotein [Variovorax rhizosphaerae]|uniref:YtcA family lipoprotein n=1 Tax=Variovorax rhizosphaerae TaxID=1836200 RepID=UPI003BF485BD
MLALASLSSGCTGAPSIPFAGAYFPAWLVCAMVGVAGAIVARLVFVSTGLAQVLPLQLFVCTAIGIMVGALAWLFWVGM